MKFVDNPELEALNSALCFDTPESRIVGGIDLFTTKPAGTDKKLFKAIDKHLYTQVKESLSFHGQQISYNGAAHSLPALPLISPPSGGYSLPKSLERKHHQRQLSNNNNNNNLNLNVFQPLSMSVNPTAFLSSSPFGPLDQANSRKVFAYLISVLNASDPDHDFSSLQPEDFKREHSSTSVVNTFNNVLFGLGMPVPPRLWECLDEQIDLKEATIYSHSPPQSFLADEPGTMWSMMWFFFNKRRKRVAFLHLKAVRHYTSPVLAAVDVSRRKNSVHANDVDEYSDEYDLTNSSDSLMYDEVVGDLELE